MKDENIKLKLIGKSIEDLKTISAYLQDSIITINDIIFLKTNKFFDQDDDFFDNYYVS